jgi:mRNA interferase MazF
VTNQAKGYPFEVPIPDGLGVSGVIVSDHIRSVDWKARRAEKLIPRPMEAVNEVLARIAPLLGY